MIRQHSSPLVRFIIQIVKPVLQLFALYVLFHGHESPGGGFQAGTILATSKILEAVTLGTNLKRYQSLLKRIYPLAAFGLLIYIGTGALGFFGGWYLDYSSLPLPGLDEATRHWWGILIVEIGVCVVVMASLVAIFDRLTDVGTGDD